MEQTISIQTMTPSVSAAFSRLFSLILSLCLFATMVKGQNIPDANFAAAIRAQCPTCINASNNLTAAASALTSLNVSGKNIRRLTGLEGFTNLRFLDCSNNLLTTLPNLPSPLIELYCQNNQLTSLPTPRNALTTLDCSFNQLTRMPLVTSVFISIKCNNNKLTSLPAFNDALGFLDCSNNQITCFSAVYTGGIPLTNDLPRRLSTLICHNNNLTHLPTIGSRMRTLKIDTNKITCLPNLPVGISVFTSRDSSASLPICRVTTHPTISNPLCTNNTLTLTAKFNGNRTVLWQRKLPTETIFSTISTSNYVANTTATLSVLPQNLFNGTSYRAIFASCYIGGDKITNVVTLTVLTPNLTVVQPTCANRSGGSITITNLPTGYSSQINSGPITAGKTVYSGLSAGVYTVRISNAARTCVSATSVVLSLPTTCATTQALAQSSNFDAAAEPTRARLSWVSSQSAETDYFTVQKLNNQTGNFEQLEVINNPFKDGNFHLLTAYDPQPTEGENTYRVELTLINGEKQLTPAKTLTYKGLEEAQVYPNPASEEAWIDLRQYEGRSVSIAISDVSGKDIFQDKIEKASAAPYRLDLMTLQTGLYFVKIQAQGRKMLTKKLHIGK